MQASRTSQKECYVTKRSKIALQGLSERVVDMYDNDKMTLTDITNVLSDEGYEVSRTGVQREVKKWEEFIAEQKEQEHLASQFLDAFKDRPNTDISELTMQIMQNKMLKALKEFDVNENSFKDASQFVHAIARLSDSQVNLDKLKIAFQTGVQAAKEQLEDEFTALLEKEHPELLLRVLDVIQSVRIESDGRKRNKRRRG